MLCIGARNLQLQRGGGMKSARAGNTLDTAETALMYESALVYESALA